MSNSTNNHGTTLKRILHYLNETKELRILYKKAPRSLILKAGIDSSGDENSNDSRSTHDHLMFMREDLISGKLSKQTSIALFSTEIEYMSQTSTAINVMGAREILKEMTIEKTISRKNLIIIYADNQKTIKLVNNSIFQKRIKHIAVKYHYIRDLISKKAIKLKYRLTSKMIADELTKSLSPIQFRRFVKQLNMSKNESIVNGSIKGDQKDDHLGCLNEIKKVIKMEFFQPAGLV